MEDSVMYKCNPLARIEIGMPDEIRQARKFAKEVVKPMNYRSTWEGIVVQCISVSVLYLLYESGREHLDIPTVEDLRNFLMCNIVEETEEDEDGNETVAVHVQDFSTTISRLLSEKCVPEGGIRIHHWDATHNNGEGGFIYKKFVPEMLQVLYPEDIVLDLDPYVHPWIYRNFLQLTNGRDTDTAASLATAALEQYIDEHPECRPWNMENKGKKHLKEPLRSLVKALGK